MIGRDRLSYVDLVFHVLAHVAVDAPASAFDSDYVRWAQATLGEARERELGELAADIAAAAPTHDALASAQRIAWLFRSVERAQSTFARGLGELSAIEVDVPSLLGVLAGDPAAELIHCAAALEAPHHANLPDVAPDPSFGERLAEVGVAAPLLGRMPIEHVRALRLRGRVHDARIWVGIPGAEVPAVDPSFVAWQAAHEATVAELSARRLPFADHEHAAVALLAARAERADLAGEHRAWLGRLRAPSPSLSSLAAPVRAIVEETLRG